MKYFYLLISFSYAYILRDFGDMEAQWLFQPFYCHVL